ncbi:MAG: MBL fold metallo-hydrolase [Candidatus Saccharibacteria bacterium]
MKITKFGHSCLLIEEAETRLLIDPGAYSTGFEDLTELDGILITHVHPDHVNPEVLAQLINNNPKAALYADEDTVDELAKQDMKLTPAHDGDAFEIKGTKIEVIGSLHAIIHPSWGQAKNVGYKIANRFYYPGDALTVPKGGIEILAIPAVAPWSKISETIDYLIEVKPQFVIPVHDGILARPSLYGQMLGGFAEQAGSKLVVLEPGIATEL